MRTVSGDDAVVSGMDEDMALNSETSMIIAEDDTQ